MNVKNPRLALTGAPIALLIILGATLIPFFMADNSTAMALFPWIFGAGSLLLLLVRLFTPYRGDDHRQKRWHRIQSWAAIFFCAATFFLFYPGAQLRDWLAFTLAAAIIQSITTFTIKN